MVYSTNTILAMLAEWSTEWGMSLATPPGPARDCALQYGEDSNDIIVR